MQTVAELLMRYYIYITVSFYTII